MRYGAGPPSAISKYDDEYNMMFLLHDHIHGDVNIDVDNIDADIDVDVDVQVDDDMYVQVDDDDVNNACRDHDDNEDLMILMLIK